jgi:hypothetical protein
MAHQNASPKDDFKLIQTRIPPAVYKKLASRMKRAGDVSMAAYVRRLLIQHVETSIKGGF